MALREDFFQFKSFKSFYREAGEGPVVLFLHPLGGSSELWLKNLDTFTSKYRVLAPDFLGFGRSDKPDIPYHLNDFAEWVLAFLDDRKADHVVIVGNSLGGHVATIAAHHYPTRIKGLVLANSCGLKSLSGSAAFRSVTLSAQIGRRLPFNPSGFMIQSILKAIHGTTGKATKELAAFYQRELHGEDHERWKRAFVRSLEAIVTTPIDAEAKELDQPVLVVWGGHDHLLGPKGGELWIKTIPKATLRVLEEVGHFPQWEAPGPFNDAVISFLSTVHRA